MDRSDIDRVYEELGYQLEDDLGWFFLLSHERSMSTAKYVTIGLNPGGKGNYILDLAA
jgi:hypothetical protein